MKSIFFFGLAVFSFYGGCTYLGNTYVTPKFQVNRTDHTYTGKVLKVELIENKRPVPEATYVLLGDGKELRFEGEVIEHFNNLDPKATYVVAYTLVMVGDDPDFSYKELKGVTKTPSR